MRTHTHKQSNPTGKASEVRSMPQWQRKQDRTARKGRNGGEKEARTGKAVCQVATRLVGRKTREDRTRDEGPWHDLLRLLVLLLPLHPPMCQLKREKWLNQKEVRHTVRCRSTYNTPELHSGSFSMCWRVSVCVCVCVWIWLWAWVFVGVPLSVSVSVWKCADACFEARKPDGLRQPTKFAIAHVKNSLQELNHK